MKIPLIALLVFSLSLVGSISNSYADVGDFITSFDGTSDGTYDLNGIAFETLFGVAVDSNDRIIVGDTALDLVQIFDSNGEFINSFDGIYNTRAEFKEPTGITVDSNDRIIIIDSSFNLVKVFDSNGDFITSIDGSDNGGTKFRNPTGITTDSNDRIIVTDTFFNTVQIFNNEGSFIANINGNTTFLNPVGVAVDSNDRIIITDTALDLIQIFNSNEGSFINSFNGNNGITFLLPIAVAIDSKDRIIIADNGLGLIQIFNSNGDFITSFDGSDCGTTFESVVGVAVDSNDRIIITDSFLNTVQIFEGVTSDSGSDCSGTIDSGIELLNKRGDGSCTDCISPTLGLNTYYKRVVDNGFSYNGNSVQVERWHTPFPLINATVGETNTVEIVVYENGGIHNMELVQFGLGGMEIGQSLSTLEVLIEVWFETFGNNHEIGIEKVVINDKDNLIENSTVVAVASIVKCAIDLHDQNCIKVTLEYSYREPTLNNMLVVNVRDKPGNSQNFYFNDGIQVVGESLNEPPTYQLFNKKVKQQTEDLYLTLTRTDIINNTWIDKYGIEYKKINENWFERITPTEAYKCTDPPLSEINVPTRQNCNFRNLTELWTYDQQE